MTTYTYFKKGSMMERPYHLIDASGLKSLCGEVFQTDVNVTRVSSAPLPKSLAFVCVACRQAAEMRDMERVV